MSQIIEKVFVVCGILLFLWICLLIIKRLVNRKIYGNVILKIKDTGSNFDLILGLIMILVTVAEIIRCVVNSRLEYNFVLMAAFVIYLLYKSSLKIEFREKGLFTRESMNLWKYIDSYNWLNTKNEDKSILVLKNKSDGKQIIFTIKTNFVADIETFLQTKSINKNDSQDINSQDVNLEDISSEDSSQNNLDKISQNDSEDINQKESE